MAETDLQQRLAEACRIVEAAGALALDYFERRQDLAVESKGLQDVVSHADRDVETLIRRELDAAFPGEAVLGEEHGGELAERLWIIDPIDGTANFLRGLPYWSVVLAYAVEGETVIGVVQDPVHGELFAAAKGSGASRNGKPVFCAETSDPATATISLNYSYKADHREHLKILERMFASRMNYRRLGSAALSLCHVADGRLDATHASHANSWDVVAGLRIAQEAGAHVTQFTNGYTFLQPRETLATAPGVAEAVSEVTGMAPD